MKAAPAALCTRYPLRAGTLTMADDEIDIPAIAARFLAQAPPLQFPPVLDGAPKPWAALPAPHSPRRTPAPSPLSSRHRLPTHAAAGC